MVRAALGLDRKNVLNPILHLKHDLPTLAIEIAEQVSGRIGKNRRQIREALEHALRHQDEFLRELHTKGKEILEAHDPQVPLVVVTGRPYNLYDERLNLRLGQNMAKIGIAAIPMDFIDVSAVDLNDFPNMYWGLGAQILRTAKFIRDYPHLFGLHMTNFSCGADSFVEHFYRYIMGDQPYLILEVDEHSAVAGMMTRLEAFKNVVENTLQKQNAAFYGRVRVSN
jgi:predicted nucleotide-binding protein (sugar kinase/HSP70/actin superfamily)